MTNPAAKSSTERRGIAMALAVAVLAGLAVLAIFFRDGSTSGDSLREAGSSEYIRSVGQLRLIAQTEPVDDDAIVPSLVGRDPANVPDSRIQVDVAVKLQEMNLPVEPLDITVEDRHVTLEGRVEDALLRDAIEVTVRSVEGVREVDNRITIVGEQ